VSIYDRTKAMLGAWLTANGFTFYAQKAMVKPGARGRMCVARVISDIDTRHADNVARVRKYRVQVDIIVDDSESDSLYGWYESAEAALMSAGALPQGNYRMEFDEESATAYTQKDYLIHMKHTEVN